jgi:hypothetical protein
MTRTELQYSRSTIYLKQRFFYWRNFARRRIFLTSGLFLAKFGPKKNFLVAKNSSILTAFIQHLDELASGYVLVVPPGRKTKNHRKNTDLKVPHLLSPSTKVVQVAAAYTATVSL